jgi:hypothetical protein
VACGGRAIAGTSGTVAGRPGRAITWLAALTGPAWAGAALARTVAWCGAAMTVSGLAWRPVASRAVLRMAGPCIRAIADRTIASRAVTSCSARTRTLMTRPTRSVGWRPGRVIAWLAGRPVTWLAARPVTWLAARSGPRPGSGIPALPAGAARAVPGRLPGPGPLSLSGRLLVMPAGGLALPRPATGCMSVAWRMRAPLLRSAAASLPALAVRRLTVAGPLLLPLPVLARRAELTPSVLIAALP